MIRLNLGGGNFHQEGWLNVDYPFEARAHKQDRSNIDVVHNFMDCKPMPFDNDSVDIVYTEHCIEHLTEEAARYFVKDIYRMMKPGGALRISCPDANIVYHHYMRNDNEPLGFNKRFNNDPREVAMLDVLATPLIGRIDYDKVSYIFNRFTKEAALSWLTFRLGNITKDEQARKPGDHLCWWHEDKLKEVLVGAGFRKVKRRGQRESSIEDFRHDYIDRTANKYSIRVECGK